MKLRISEHLHDSARACARAIDDTLSDWVANAVRQAKAGKFDGVAIDPELRKATREGSTVITIRGTGDPRQIRIWIAEAVTWVRIHSPPAFDVEKVYKGKFVIEEEE